MPPALARPTPEELAAGQDKSLPDLIRPGLMVLFVGINPGLWSGAVGRHFGNPANRLWPVLHQAGFTSRRLLPTDADELLAAGYGVSNLVNRATATAAEVGDDELRLGAQRLRDTVRRYRPATVAFLGLTAYRVAFNHPKAAVGPQPELLESAPVWLLPNPSGLNAHYQLPELVRLYGALRASVADADADADAVADFGGAP